MASSSTKLTLKLLIDTKSEKVLFAEASKAVIDFLFSLLCLPLSTVIGILNKNNDMVGCLGNLYQSVENLDRTYMQPNQRKDILLKPRASICSPEISGLLPSAVEPSKDNLTSKFYRCPNHTYRVTCNNTTRCPEEYCHYTMSSEMTYVGNRSFAEYAFPEKCGGFVKEVVTYMVMDDLVIQPMSTISSITLLNKFNVKEVAALEEKVVQLGMTEAVNLLRVSLQSKMVLTSVFLESNTGS